MPGHPGRTSLPAAMLLFALTLGPLPARAQDPSATPGTPEALSEEVAQLRERVAKLEGRVKARDLVGTYALVVLDMSLNASVPGRNATITPLVATGTLKLNADGTYTGFVKLAANILTEGSWTLDHAEVGPGTEGGTWTYANGVVTLTSNDVGGDPPIGLFVSLGGGLLTGATAEFRSASHESDTSLVIASRIGPAGK